MTVAVMLVWAGQFPIGLLADTVDHWSAAAGGAIETASVVLFLPVTIIVAVWVARRRPRWPSLDSDRLSGLLDTGERPIAVIAVRIAGTQPWRPGLLFVLVGEGALLGLLALSGSALALVFLPMALLIVPGMLLAVGMSNRVAERSARRGRLHSTARAVPRSDGRPPNWLVLTDRRLALVGSGCGSGTGLVWHVSRSTLELITDAGRSLRTLDRTIRLHFTDGSSVRMTVPDARPLLAASD